ncbi:MAG: HNH endonuclease signature motif containing protein [Pseudomonadota bacterium]
MVLKQLKDDELNSQLLKSVQQERKLTGEILDLLKEVEGRKLFARRGFSSIFAYCTEFLGYSESAAQRRISSMRLIREVPQVQAKVKSGDLNLSNVAQAARFFRREKKIYQKTYTPREKATILGSMQGKTQKEAERQLIQISPRPFQEVDEERVLNDEIRELRLTLHNEIFEKLERLRELKPGFSTQELLNWMLSRTLKQIDPLVKPGKTKVMPRKSPPLSKYATAQRKKLSRSLKHQVWKRAKGGCQFKDHQSDRACQSQSVLEIDHIKPLSLGGDNRLENLRLLCREHHRLFTKETFRNRNMQNWIK